MRNILIFCAVFLVGCTTVPVKQNFPEANSELMQKCDSLELIDKPEINLKELTKSVVKNYGKYHNCANLVEAWQEWYTKQKKISQDANK